MSHAEAWCWKVAETAYKEKAKQSGFTETWKQLSVKNKDKWYRYAFWVMRALDVLE